MNRSSHTGEPIIRPVPTIEGFKTMVDQLITPDRPEDEAKVFIDMILTTANPDDDHSWALANEAARHAFTKTEAFEQAFRNFAGFPDRPGYTADRYVITAGERSM